MVFEYEFAVLNGRVLRRRLFTTSVGGTYAWWTVERLEPRAEDGAAVWSHVSTKDEPEVEELLREPDAWHGTMPTTKQLELFGGES